MAGGKKACNAEAIVALEHYLEQQEQQKKV